MPIPTEPIGSIPRPKELIAGMQASLPAAELEALFDEAVKDTIARFEATGSPVITDGEQRKPSFVTYPIAGLTGLAPGGVTIPFADGHTRQLPVLTAGPFSYATHAVTYLDHARPYASRPLKQAVISASALSLLYPQDGIDGYPRDEFIADLLEQAEYDIRWCLEGGADSVQIDFTEGRLALKLDPSGGVLSAFVDLNNQLLNRFGDDERALIGVHTCPGGDHDSTHSADVDYVELLPALFGLNAGRFYLQLASEGDRPRVLQAVADHSLDSQKIFVGVIDPIDPRVESPEEVRDRVLEAARFIPLDRLGTTDDCGFSPFGDDTSTARDTAFAKIQARVEGTKLAEAELGL
jgi:5-methyltetrahydropteroyltriglutamate--homocysteine methyltransferase